jgi:hypothetical protein
VQFGVHAGRKLSCELGCLERVIRSVCRNKDVLHNRLLTSQRGQREPKDFHVDPNQAKQLLLIGQNHLAFDADERSEAGDAPSKACLLSRQYDSSDILICAGCLLSDAAH